MWNIHCMPPKILTVPG